MVEDYPRSLDTVKPNQTSFKISPVPAFTRLDVFLTNDTKDNWQVFNVSGVLIDSGKATFANFQIDVSHYLSGVYILKVGNEIRRFIKT